MHSQIFLLSLSHHNWTLIVVAGGAAFQTGELNTKGCWSADNNAFDNKSIELIIARNELGAIRQIVALHTSPIF
jgi:hypothetical protein